MSLKSLVVGFKSVRIACYISPSYPCNINLWRHTVIGWNKYFTAFSANTGSVFSSFPCRLYAASKQVIMSALRSKMCMPVLLRWWTVVVRQAYANFLRYSTDVKIGLNHCKLAVLYCRMISTAFVEHSLQVTVREAWYTLYTGVYVADWQLTSSRRVRTSSVLNQFYSLLNSETFLLCFVRMLDAQANFSIKERRVNDKNSL